MLFPEKKWSWYKSALNSELKMWQEPLYSPERRLPFSYLQSLLLLSKRLLIFQNEVFVFGKWFLSPQGISDCWGIFVCVCLEQNSTTELGFILPFFFFFKLSDLSKQVIQEIGYQGQRKQLLFKIIGMDWIFCKNYVLHLLTEMRQFSLYMLHWVSKMLISKPTLSIESFLKCPTN